jgi:hypothetical protein
MIELAYKTIKDMDYDTAWLHCLVYEKDGHKDWRLPSRDEYFNTDGIHPYTWFEKREDDTKWFCQPVRTKDD